MNTISCIWPIQLTFFFLDKKKQQETQRTNQHQQLFNLKNRNDNCHKHQVEKENMHDTTVESPMRESG